jgi:hypothetical protein
VLWFIGVASVNFQVVIFDEFLPVDDFVAKNFVKFNRWHAGSHKAFLRQARGDRGMSQ